VYVNTSTEMDIVAILRDTFVPNWITGAPPQPKQTEINALDAFRQRIYMQQVIRVVVLYVNSIFISVD